MCCFFFNLFNFLKLPSAVSTTLTFCTIIFIGVVLFFVSSIYNGFKHYLRIMLCYLPSFAGASIQWFIPYTLPFRQQSTLLTSSRTFQDLILTRDSFHKPFLCVSTSVNTYTVTETLCFPISASLYPWLRLFDCRSNLYPPLPRPFYWFIYSLSIYLSPG